MSLFRSILAIFARVFLSAVFLVNGVKEIISWEESERRFMHILADWQVYLSSFDQIQPFLSSLMVYAPVLLMTAICLEILGGGLLFLGVKEKFGAFLLVLYLIPASVLLHPFWFLHAMDEEIATALFLRDLAIFGGLFLVILHGAKGVVSSNEGSDAQFG